MITLTEEQMADGQKGERIKLNADQEITLAKAGLSIMASRCKLEEKEAIDLLDQSVNFPMPWRMGQFSFSFAELLAIDFQTRIKNY